MYCVSETSTYGDPMTSHSLSRQRVVGGVMATVLKVQRHIESATPSVDA